MKTVFIALFILTISGLNVYLPDVGNLFDTWRIWFSVVSFVVGWCVLIKGLTKITD